MINTNLFIISFGELDISPVIFGIIVFIAVFVFFSVFISTTKLIQSLVENTD